MAPYSFKASRERSLSSDGRTLVFFEAGEGGGVQSAGFLRRTDGSPAVRLSDGTCGALSRDAKRVICVTPEGQLNQVPTKTGEIEPLTHDRLIHGAAVQWFRDEKRFLFLGGEPGHSPRLYVQDVGSGQARAITSEGATVYYRVSPDGDQLAAAVGADYRTWVYPVSGGEPRPVPGLEAGEVPVAWSSDNRFLYCFRLGELPINVFRVEVATGRRTPWKQLVPPDPVGITLLSSIFLSSDKTSYVYTFNRKLDVVYLVEGLH